VEIEKEIIELVFNQIKTSKMSIIQADAWKYLVETDKKYDFIYIDIWSSVTMKEIEKAIELGKRCLKPNGEIRCWVQELYYRLNGKRVTARVASLNCHFLAKMSRKCFFRQIPFLGVIAIYATNMTTSAWEKHGKNLKSLCQKVARMQENQTPNYYFSYRKT
jgi:spermidine synthase